MIGAVFRVWAGTVIITPFFHATTYVSYYSCFFKFIFLDIRYSSYPSSPLSFGSLGGKRKRQILGKDLKDRYRVIWHIKAGFYRGVVVFLDSKPGFLKSGGFQDRGSQRTSG